MTASSMDPTRDELEIRNLLAALAWHADTTTMEDLDQYVDCFTEDAEWEMFGDVRKGHAAILAGAQERRRNRTNGPGTDVRHALTATVVTFDGPDLAHVRSYIQAYKTASSNPTLYLMGEYHDTFRRTAKGWKMAARNVKF